MKSNPIYLLIFLFFITLSCSTNNLEKGTTGKTLDFKTTLVKELVLPSGITNINDSYQPFGSNSVFFLNEHSKTLYELDLIKNKIDSTTTLDSLTFFDGFIVEPKSKLVYVFYHDKVQVYAFNGELKRTVNLTTACDTSTYLTVLNQTYLPHIHDNSIFIQSFPAFEESYTNPLFFQEPIMESFDLKNMDCQTTKAFYPINYQQNCYGVNYIPEKIVLENELDHKVGFTYAYNDSIFIYDANLGSTRTEFFGSKAHLPIVKQLPFDKIDQYNQSILDDLYATNPSYAFTKSFPLAGFVGRSLLLKSNSKITEFLCLYDDKFEYIGESNGVWKPNIFCDSEQGIKSIQLKIKEKQLIINDVTWE